MESMVSKMGKSGMMGGGNAKQRAQIQQMQKNPQAMMKQLQNNPQAMQMVREFLYLSVYPTIAHDLISIRHRCSR